MAKAIKPTPTLSYKESKRFLSQLGSNDNGVYTDKKALSRQNVTLSF